MGSSGMKKKRKRGGSRQHLDKVGTHSHSAAEHEQHAERQAVLDTMGMGGASGVGRMIIWVVLGLMAVFGIIGILILTVR